MELRPNSGDLGALAFRLSFLKTHKLYFGGPDGNYWVRSEEQFVEEAAKRANGTVVLRETLFVHQ